MSKGRAIRYLARRARIPLGAVLAIGDQWNDVEMLSLAGHGTAMPTAPADAHLLLARVGMRVTPARLAIWQAL